MSTEELTNKARAAAENMGIGMFDFLHILVTELEGSKEGADHFFSSLKEPKKKKYRIPRKTIHKEEVQYKSTNEQVQRDILNILPKIQKKKRIPRLGQQITSPWGRPGTVANITYNNMEPTVMVRYYKRDLPPFWEIGGRQFPTDRRVGHHIVTIGHCPDRIGFL